MPQTRATLRKQQAELCIAASNFGSDQGSVDSCNYSSHGSDSNSRSSPCSPEEPDRYSRGGTPQPMPPIPLSLQEEEEEESRQTNRISTDKQCVHSDTRTRVDVCESTSSVPEPSDSGSTLTKSKNNIQRHFYLQDSCSVPNFESVSSSSSFQRAENQNCISSCENSCSTVASDKLSESSQRLSCAKPTCVQTTLSSSNSTNQSNGSSTHELQPCRWHQCASSVESSDELVEHIRSQHVQLQKDKDSFVCLWEGCKVYNRASCSLSWLERHVLSHGGNRPFKCIVDGCSQRFPTQAALQRHVNSHFESHSQGVKANKCRDESLSKSFRRKKHLKYKKRSACGRTEDFFDANIMEQIRYKLIERHTCSDVSNSSRQITFHSRIKARRLNKSGKTDVLLEWIPQNILPDCWGSEDTVVKSKTVAISSLPRESVSLLGLQSNDPPRAKQRRK